MNWRVAVRSLGRSPGFTLVAVVTLVLGIGAISAIFSVVNSVLLRPLAGAETERLVLASEVWPRYDGGVARARTYREWQRLTDIFDEIGARQYCNLNLTGAGDPEQLVAPCVTASWFGVYRVNALFGRTFLPDEDQAGHDRVVVLDHAFWIRRFGGDRGVIGRSITLDQNPYTVVGVMPPDFHPDGQGNASIYMPWVLAQNEITSVAVTARLRRGVSAEKALAALTVIAKRLEKLDPDDAGLTAKIVPLIETVVGPYRDLLKLLTAAAALVLLIACVNVANLFLARGAAKRRETEIRGFLGANRWQLLAPSLAESAIVSTIGGGLGLLSAWAIARLLAVRLQNFPRADEIQVDTRVVLVAAAVTILTAFAPVFSRRKAQRGALVIAQVTLTFVLLICAGLLIRSFVAMRRVDLGYNPNGVMAGFVSQPEDLHDQRDAGIALRRRIRERIAALPGIDSVAMSSRLPPGGVVIGLPVIREGEDANAPRPKDGPTAEIVIASDEYFRAAGIPLRAGRTFSEHGDARVVIVSQSIASRFFSGSALGKRIQLPEFGYNIKSIGAVTTREIVGVAADIKETSVRETGPMIIYLPESQAAVRFTNLVVRVRAGDPMAAERAVRRAMFQEAPELAVNPMRRLDVLNSYLTDTPRRAMWLLGLFAAIALVLASVGVHGVISYAAAQRSREMGIRMALGARPSQLFVLVTRQALALAAAGAAIGVALAYAATRLLETLLFGVVRTDPATYFAGVLLLVFVATMASLTPALRAARTDSAVILRAE